MTEESVVVKCPNPKCGKDIREPMLLTILCVTPPEQYEACPYCFAKLQPEDYPPEPEAPEFESEQNKETDLEEESEVEELAEELDEDEEDSYEEEDEYEADESYNEEDDYEDILPERDDVQEKVKPSASFLQRVKSLIPSNNESKKEKAVQQDYVSAVEPEEELEDEEDSYEEEDEYEADESDDEEAEDEEEFETDEPEEDDEEDEDEPEEEEPEAKPFVSTESKKEGCPEVFGYLANREKDVPIPAVCYMCPRMVDCMLSPRDD